MGNASNITHRVAHAEAITEAGSSLLLLDYRGIEDMEGARVIPRSEVCIVTLLLRIKNYYTGAFCPPKSSCTVSR
jgi:hypothetical protein